MIMHGKNIPFAYGFWSLVVVNIGDESPSAMV